MLCLQALLALRMALFGSAFTTMPIGSHEKVMSTTSSSSLLFAQKQTRSSAAAVVEDDEKTADIVGAEFFGGNKQKEELYDPVAEATAGKDDVSETSFDKFSDRTAFEDELSSKIASSLQSQINSILYEGSPTPDTSISYASSLKEWSTPLSKNSNNPMKELENALEFYKEVHVAITSSRTLNDNSVELGWEISVLWPGLWEPRVILSGSSKLQLDADQEKIVGQTDELFASKDALASIGPQLSPRFWDLYHIGMTPSAELSPRLQTKGGLNSYSVYDMPARWMACPTRLDNGDRNERNAQTVPSHAFSCIIKTMGPQKQRYVPVSPVQVQIIPGGPDGLELKWSIPLSVEFQTSAALPLPGDDKEAEEGSRPEFNYEYQPRRRVATVPYGGEAQDEQIKDIRKKLYEDVVKAGLKPKMDANGRPEFFFVQNCLKACYTEEGLGMCVYEWRPEAVKPNEVGLELTI